MSGLSSISQLNIESVISRYQNGIDEYTGIVRAFYRNSSDTANLLTSLFETGDFENYTIKVHALKSVAASIGAMSLSERAKSHEMAGKADNISFIQNDFKGLINEFSELNLALADIFDKEEENLPTKGKPDAAYVQNQLSKIAEFLDEFELDPAMDILNELTDYDCDPELRNMLNEAIHFGENFEYEKLGNLISDFLNHKPSTTCN